MRYIALIVVAGFFTLGWASQHREEPSYTQADVAALNALVGYSTASTLKQRQDAALYDVWTADIDRRNP